MTLLTPSELREIRERDARTTIYDSGTIHERVTIGGGGPLAAVDRRALLRHADALNDQLQASQCAEAMNADVIKAQAQRIAELEAGIRQWASECGECGGTGWVNATHPSQYECTDCADIRALLPKGQP